MRGDVRVFGQMREIRMPSGAVFILYASTRADAKAFARAAVAEGWTQSKVAEYCGVDQATVSLWLREGRAPV